jgi:hypothetical protein
MAVLEDTVICGYIQHPADMVEIFNAWGTAAALQVLLEGYGMVEQFRALRLCQMLFLPGFLQGGAEDLGITDG